MAFLNKGIKITLVDERTDTEKVYQYEGGLISFVKFLNKNKQPLHQEPLYISSKKDDIIVEAALQYNDSYNENLYSFANNINTMEGGIMPSVLKCSNKSNK